MDDIDLDNIEDLSLDKLGAAIGRTLSRLERLQALYLAVAADDREGEGVRLWRESGMWRGRTPRATIWHPSLRRVISYLWRSRERSTTSPATSRGRRRRMNIARRG
jgi:hypothetical protein